ncbi:mRNA 3'-end-processing protein RNA14 [Coprinopsis cinerea okayama7|uniref:mRNA 3'-end-processing protein RNA14 n=1 Tax=Coprinopsis cinerea (strain Okayama-7 / 130 / ATCC MYA-4618 / FGSC 9003) TaxID=240176 RepID=A8P7L9_COPC7|nr:mRNA 3'-end-processing protein RNA14 [Coprinopsis cinerea okayama7\|eukprot:XP_001839388.2 mRNA 3'-end-processing protein RNA14 [Coprinopsis cinerea okayama7\
MDEPQNDEHSFQGEATQPTEEIIAALNASNASEQSNPPQSEFDGLFSKLSENPYDPDGWRRLIDLANESGEITKIQQAYNELLKHYPNTSAAQIAYINHFLNKEDTFTEAEQLFIKFLRTSPSVDLWKFYLTYVRRRNVGPATRDIVRKSYEFALQHVGQDKESGEIWNDYIQFLKAGETSSTWEEQQKMDALRKVYHRAVQIPLDNVERLWSELETFEMNLNKITAKKFMSDLSPAHMQARTTLRQLSNHMNGLYPPSSSNNDLFLPSQPKFDAAERSLVGKWKAYLKWEESNPLELEDKDKQTFITRLQGVYRKAVIRMRFYAEIWFMAYTWTNSVGKTDEALAILKAGMEAVPSSFLLTFAYAEAMELKKDFAEVHSAYEKLLSVLVKELEALEKSTANANTNGTQQNGSNPNNTNDTSFNSQSSDDKPPKNSELQEKRTEYGLVYIMYMRFARRTEGLAALRRVFAKARRDRFSPWEVYEACALMEYHCFDDKNVASRIFEKGLEQFGDEIDYVLRYLGFLISINDGNNARALFERVITTFSPERARPLWERWARYEYQYGDLESALKLEKRIAEVYPTDPPIKRFAQRHMYLGTDAIAARDLGFSMAKRAGTSASSSNNSLGRTETSGSLLTGLGPSNAAKRPASPDNYRNPKRDDKGGDYGAGHKRARGPASPAREREIPPPRDRDRDVQMRDRDRGDRGDRWNDRGRRGSPGPGGWDRDRDDRDGGRGRGGPAGGGRDGGRDYPRGPPEPQIPPLVSWFMGELPPAASFDGPIFKTDDLMKAFKQAQIPAAAPAGGHGGPAAPMGPPHSTAGRNRSPAPTYPQHRGGGRPPPDYGPYQGPGGGRAAGRRY